MKRFYQPYIELLRQPDVAVLFAVAAFARMPVSMEFSMARRKLVSVIKACCACKRLRVCRHVPINIHVVMPLSNITNQKRPLPIRTCDVR